MDGMILLQEIGIAFLCSEKNTLLAGKLETWFYYYKKEWRTVSRESELYRIQNVINEVADRLRS